MRHAREISYPTTLTHAPQSSDSLRVVSPAHRRNRASWFDALPPRDWSSHPTNRRRCRLLGALYPGSQCTAGRVPVRIIFVLVCARESLLDSPRVDRQYLAGYRDICLIFSFSLSLSLSCFLNRIMISPCRCWGPARRYEAWRDHVMEIGKLTSSCLVAALSPRTTVGGSSTASPSDPPARVNRCHRRRRRRRWCSRVRAAASCSRDRRRYRRRPRRHPRPFPRSPSPPSPPLPLSPTRSFRADQAGDPR